MSGIHITKNGQQQGPYSVEQINNMLQNGELESSDSAWMEGMQGWEPLTAPTFTQSGVGPGHAPAPEVQQTAESAVQASPNAVATSAPSGGGTFSIGGALSEGFAFFKDNAIACIIWLILAGILGCIPLVNIIVAPLMAINFLACVKAYRNEGAKMEVGQLFDFSHAGDKILDPCWLESS